MDEPMKVTPTQQIKSVAKALSIFGYESSKPMYHGLKTKEKKSCTKTPNPSLL
jgi:hypothetical protein